MKHLDENGVGICPGPDCWMCNGEACLLCRAGFMTRHPDEPDCEHDVVERHQNPPARKVPK